ncbi:hypothetical protein RHD99_21905 [Buttiauxella selenatireducens]|uniref:Tli3-like domain-containing protein n=1 Tax=Buttiauxella selenatireducens TaxID=3073902 RepID=A0ABY9S971_9ENTR|nr:hypothetical protein [Buttiauxella sp. R73]WMY74050.1 hypothetical protein RHD99_21905 [Buttiauxella sp. R73]
MKPFKKVLIVLGISLISGCHSAPKTPPTQVVYRFYDHRYLELTGFNCQGGLRYIDTKLKIRYQIYDVSDGYRIFTKKFIHPSERYIAITSFEGDGFSISKDYGRTWDGASFSPGGGAVRYADDQPHRDEIESFTVVNDQGFMLTKTGDIYMSSKPFDAVDPESGQGGKWGKEYASWNSFAGPESWTIDANRKNFQNIPNKIPEVKNYTGWDKMRCDPDLGLPPSS